MKLSGPIELIKKSVEIFFKKENLVYFLKIYLLLVPFSIFFLFENKFFDSLTGLPYNLQLGIIFGIVGLIYILVQFFISLAGIEAIRRVVEGGDYSVGQTFSFARKNLWEFSLVSILVFLAIFGGAILLIIPGIIFAIWFSFSKFVFVDQKSGVIESMKKSRQLVKGKFWAVLGRLIVFGLFSALAGYLTSAVPYVGAMISTAFGALFVLPTFLLYEELSKTPPPSS